MHISLNGVPESLFHPVRSASAPVVAGALLSLFRASVAYGHPLPYDMALSLVADSLQSSWAEARQLLYELRDNGWVSLEIPPDSCRICTLSDAAISLLATLDILTTNELPSPTGPIYAIHDLLAAAQHDSIPQRRILEAHRQSRHLRILLTQLHHTMTDHIMATLEMLASQNALDAFLTQYRGESLDPMYHQLQTDRQLVPTCTAIRDMINHYACQESMLLFRKQLAEMQTVFEYLERLIAHLKIHHRRVIHAAIGRATARQTPSPTLPTSLQTILRHLAAQTDDHSDIPLPQPYHSLLHLFRLTFVNAQSLAPPPTTSTPAPFHAVHVSPMPPSPAALEAIQTHINTALARAHHTAHVEQLVCDLLQDRPYAHASELPFRGVGDITLLMRVRALGNGAYGYFVEELEDGEVWVEQAGCRFRDFVIRRVRK